MDIRENINDTRKGFEELFAAGDFYNRQTQDSEHLEKITEFVKIVEGMRVLDLGTGSGYLSFPLAKDNPGCEIIGLDISATHSKQTAQGQRPKEPRTSRL